MSDFSPLTADEVEALLRFVEDYDPIVIGGQSIGIWAELFHGENQTLDAMSPLTSKDIDFLHDLGAERALEAALRHGRLIIPGVDDSTPEAAVVTGYLGDKKVTIDFLGSVLGVDTEMVRKRSIKISDPEKQSVSITLMHPLDCVRSRLSNVNILGRTDHHSVQQALASLIILDCYIDRELVAADKDAIRRAAEALLEIEQIVKDFHVGKTSCERFGDQLNVLAVAQKYLSDDRLDRRFREHQLAALIDRSTARLKR